MIADIRRSGHEGGKIIGNVRWLESLKAGFGRHPRATLELVGG